MANVGATGPVTIDAPSGVAPGDPGPHRPNPWVWMAVACVLLGTSAVGRIVQDRRHRLEASVVEDVPFPLETISRTLGGWRSSPGGDRQLDPLTMRITGGTDHISRSYVDELTGVSLGVLVLFGPAEPVLPHTPEVCYASTGYATDRAPVGRPIGMADGSPAGFRAAVYRKAGGRSVIREEAYHSFRLDGKWSPDAGRGRRFARRNPSIFKVQVSRRVVEGEQPGDDEPIEQFLGLLLPEIEKRVAGSSPAP